MDPKSSLTDMYQDIKSRLYQGNNSPEARRFNPGKFQATTIQSADKLTNDCAKHIIVDIYCHILPFDRNANGTIDGVSQKDLNSDIDKMLATKGTSPIQYLKSCYEKTKAPLVEFMINSTDIMRKTYMESAEEVGKDAEEKNLDVDPPEGSTEDEQIASQLVDVEGDVDYTNFIDQLKQRTIDRIVNDITDIINDKKEDANMVFQPQSEMTESVVGCGMDYLIKEVGPKLNGITETVRDQIMGYAIREAAMYEMNDALQMNRIGENILTNLKLGHGILINESTANLIVEANDKRYEPTYKETQDGKFDIANFEKVDSTGKRTKMTDEEAKKHLTEDEYAEYKKTGTA